MEPLHLAVFATVVAASAVQALAGFGFALAAVPLLSLLLGPRTAVVVCNSLVLCMSAWAAWRYRADVRWRSGVTLAASGALGMPLGLALALLVTDSALELLVGTLILTFAAMTLQHVAMPDGRLPEVAAGVLSGALLASTGMNGPPLATALQGAALSPGALRATLQAVFAVQAGTVLTLVAATGGMQLDLWLVLAVAAPALVVGWRLGDRAFQAVPVERHRHVVLATLLASAATTFATVALG